MIRVSGLRKTYRMGDTEVRALNGVDLSIEPGDFVAIMGPSGSGKSTLMHVLGLLDQPDGGSFEMMGRDVSDLPEDELAALRAKTIGFVFQQFNLLPRTSALENAALPLLYAPDGRSLSRPEQLLKDVGLGTRMQHKPNELSGGQQQRVAIARALVNNPSILLADEPTGNLDSHSEKEIMELLCGLNERGITVIVVTHEQEIADYARRVIRMRDGVVQSDERTERGRAAVSKTQPRGRASVSAPPAARSIFNPKELSAHFRQAVRALSANKVRTGLSMLGILIGVAAVIAMLALGRGAQKSIEARLSSLGSNLLAVRPGSLNMGGVSTGAGGGRTRFTLEDAKDIADSVPGVRRVSASVDNRGQVAAGNKNWNTMIMGTTPDYAPMRNAVPVAGRFLTEDENRARARVAVVGMTVVRELFGGRNPIGDSLKINRINFRVIGVLPERGSTGWRDQDDIVIIPLSTAMRRVFGLEFVEDIDVEIDSMDRMEAAEKNIRDLILRRHRLPPSQAESVRVRNMAEIQEALTETSRTMSLLLASIAAISLLVGGIGIMNIMLVSVTERTREIGLRKALGARRGDILSQFLIESVVVSLAGGVAGILLGWSVTLALSALAGWAAVVSINSVLLAFVFSASVGVVFGLWPARKASLLNPIVALRYE